VAEGEISMAYFPQTNSTERTAQIDTVGWVFVVFVIGVRVKMESPFKSRLRFNLPTPTWS
jgi:hypothetical protein